MKNYRLNDFFGKARSIPAEMSFNEVAQMVSGFPSIVNKPWYSKINLNSILMISATLILSTISLLLFQENTNESSSYITVENFPNTKDTHIETIEATQRPFSFFLPNDTIQVDLDITFKEPNDHNLAEEIEAEKLTITAEPPSSLNISQKKTVFESREDFETKDVLLNTSQARSLQKQLKEYTEHYSLNRGKRSWVKLEYSHEFLIVNSDTLHGTALNQFRTLLFEHGITPGQNRYVFSDKKYLMAGDFNDKAFRGTVYGRLMEVSIKETRGFVKQTIESKRDSALYNLYITDIKATDEKFKEATFIDTHKTSLSTIQPSEKDSVDQSKLEELHSEIEKLFRTFKLDIKGKYGYTLAFTSSEVTLGQKRLSEQEKSQITKLLNQYSVILKNDRLLMMNHYGIVVLDKVAPKKNRLYTWAKEGRILKIYGSDDLEQIERQFLRDN